MHVIYESTDAMIDYGLLNSEDRPWISDFFSGPPLGDSGPAVSAADETAVPLAWTRTHTRDAFARIDFFGMQPSLKRDLIESNILSRDLVSDHGLGGRCHRRRGS